MSDYKEFQGKTLDEAIREACVYFDAPREKLEIEIVTDAKTGIFGLVGARKATINARRVHLEHVLDSLEEPAPSPPPAAGTVGAEEGAAPPPREKTPAAKPAERGGRGKKQALKETKADSAAASEKAKRERKAKAKPEQGSPRAQTSSGGRSEKRPEPHAGSPVKPAPKIVALRPVTMEVEDGGDELPRVPLDELDQTLLIATTREVVGRLVETMLDDARCEVACASDRLRVSISSPDNSGLLIGKDGQTLASLQYLATRMVSNKIGSLVRVHVDAGDYRERQDERLRDLALDLAAKVKANNRPQLTRPLTSYQRRVIHVTLQDDPLVQTHSKGEGELKRVVITLRRRQDKQSE